MSNMESLEGQLTEQERRARVTQTALTSIHGQDRSQEAAGYALMAAFAGYGDGALGSGGFGKVSHAAKLFCILFAMLVPSLLIWQVML
ncbi:hypothetical protein [Roseobacter sp.]|uniref:hypothetical protein n=1 Tax=Roseobacter sp. TaxID=1907202 RepID=UPI003299F8BA